MLDTYLVPENSVVTARGDGVTVDISLAENRVFLVLLDIQDTVEQESIDVSVWGSADEKNWGAKAVGSLPQKFYRGEHPLLLDVTAQPDIKFLRAHWEVNRWGRGSETPRFVFSLKLTEVAPEILRETALPR